MTGDARARIGAVVGKELRDFRRNRFVILTMALLPLVFIVVPAAEILSVRAVPRVLVGHVSAIAVYLLVVPAVVPTVLAAQSVVGEREQGTIEPLLATPLTRDELVIAKGLAAAGPAIVLAYLVYGVFLVVVAVGATAAVRGVILTPANLVLQLVFTPLLAFWSIWVGIAISTRSRDVRVAQQLSSLAGLVPLAVIAVIEVGAVPEKVLIAWVSAVVLIVADLLIWRVAARLLDAERLLLSFESPRARLRQRAG